MIQKLFSDFMAWLYPPQEKLKNIEPEKRKRRASFAYPHLGAGSEMAELKLLLDYRNDAVKIADEELINEIESKIAFWAYKYYEDYRIRMKQTASMDMPEFVSALHANSLTQKEMQDLFIHDVLAGRK